MTRTLVVLLLAAAAGTDAPLTEFFRGTGRLSFEKRSMA